VSRGSGRGGVGAELRRSGLRIRPANTRHSEKEFPPGVPISDINGAVGRHRNQNIKAAGLPGPLRQGSGAVIGTWFAHASGVVPVWLIAEGMLAVVIVVEL
jgi:hypothetical protein